LRLLKISRRKLGKSWALNMGLEGFKKGFTGCGRKAEVLKGGWGWLVC